VARSNSSADWPKQKEKLPKFSLQYFQADPASLARVPS
jgi:hypothetical protein